VTRFLSEINFIRTQWHVFCPILIPFRHSAMFSFRDFGITWLRMEHKDVFSVQDFGITWLRIGQSDVFSVRDFSIRTQWHVFCPRFWNYMTQNRTKGRVFCPRFRNYMTQNRKEWRFLSEIFFQSDTVTCFLSDILELHESIGHSDVLCPRFIPARHSYMFCVRDVGVTRLRIGHSYL
jgi:hypothetical protein